MPNTAKWTTYCNVWLRYGHFKVHIPYWVLHFRSCPKLESFEWRNWNIKCLLISARNCYKELILASGYFYDHFSFQTCLNPIISQIHLFVTSHYFTLFTGTIILLFYYLVSIQIQKLAILKLYNRRANSPNCCV